MHTVKVNLIVDQDAPADAVIDDSGRVVAFKPTASAQPCNCYFHFDQLRPSVAIVNNGQFDMPVCGSCLAVALGCGYTLVTEV